MSVVKTVKSRRALLTALEQTPKDKFRWWDHKQRILEQWLDTSGDEIGVEGASQLIRGQLQRGYSHEHLRIKCWKHIVIELSALVDDDTAPSNGASPAMTNRRGSNSYRASGDTSPTDRGGGDSGTVDLSGLSFVERQEEWLRRKQNALRAKTHDLDRAAKDGATFNPNLALSQTSLRPAQVAAVELKLEQLANEAERDARKSSFSLSIQEAKRRSEREAAPAPINTATSRRRTRMKRRGSAVDEPGHSPRRATAPSVSFNGVRDDLGHLNPAGEGDSDDGLDGQGVPEIDGNGRGGESDGGDRGGSVGEGEPISGDGRGEGEDEGGDINDEPQEPPFEKGSFFFKVDDKDKGHYRVRDVSRFLLTSMYKRKDRVTRTPGVSLLVGKLEDPPHEEKVISALFDIDRFSERLAAQWWENNGHRFEDARSLAEKKSATTRVVIALRLPPFGIHWIALSQRHKGKALEFFYSLKALDDERQRKMKRNDDVLRRSSAPARAASAAMNASNAMSSTAPATFLGTTAAGATVNHAEHAGELVH